MDTLSHGLWGGIFFGRKLRKDFWVAFLFGVLPDILSFGIYIVGSWAGIFSHPDFSSGRHPDPSMIPSFVQSFYNVTHSLVIFCVVAGVVYLIRKRMYWPMLAWPLHILYDIPTHSADFFPTPFLWPLSDYFFHGTSWGQPWIFFPNWIALLFCLYWFFLRSRWSRKNSGETAVGDGHGQKVKNAL